jgi:hypothetical protein
MRSAPMEHRPFAALDAKKLGSLGVPMNICRR